MSHEITPLESIRRTNPAGNEFWSSRDFAKVLGHMGSTELAANLFRANQAEDKLRRETITGKDKASKAQRDVGAKVRQTIQELGGTMPEALPPAESIKKLEFKAREVLNKPES